MKVLRHAAVLILAASGCAAPSNDTAPAGLAPDDDAAVRTLVADWDRAWVEGNEAVVRLLADDYVEARTTAVQGREAALAGYNTFTGRYTAVTSTPIRIEGTGNLAWGLFSFDGRYVQDGSARHQTGSTLLVFRRNADGRWQIAGGGWQSASRPDSTAD